MVQLNDYGFCSMEGEMKIIIIMNFSLLKFLPLQSVNTSFNHFVNLIQSNIFSTFEYSIFHLTMYDLGCNNSIVEDKYLFNFIVKMP